MLKPERIYLNVNCPEAIYLSVQKAKDAEGVDARDVIGGAIGEHLDEVANLLREAGFASADLPRLARMPLDKKDNGRLRKVAEELGVDASTVLLACLRRHFDASRKKSAAGARPKPRKKPLS